MNEYEEQENRPNQENASGPEENDRSQSNFNQNQSGQNQSEQNTYGQYPYGQYQSGPYQSYQNQSYQNQGYQNQNGQGCAQNGYQNYQSGYGNNSGNAGPGYGQQPPKKKSHTGLVAALITVAALLLVGTGIFVMVRSLVVSGSKNSRYEAQASEKTEESTEESTETEKSSSAVSLVKSGSVSTTDTSGEVILTDVSQIVENVMPCLVAITDNLELASNYSYSPYSYFFGNSSQSTTQTVSSASGVIIGQNDEELLIVTNNHVVSTDLSSSGYTVLSSDFTVTFVDGESAPLTVKGTDEAMDLAVVAVRLSDLSESTKEAIRIAVVGNSDELKVGSGVIAIGNAKGYGQSVTMGIISAKDREVVCDDTTRTLLQTDAAINPGNSGGGLFNAKGELIGINESKYADTDIEGMCFAIPITAAEEVIERLMNMETISEEEQGYLGIQGAAVPDSYISSYGYPAGVSVTRITENSPAETAGLQIYDIISSINGVKVTSMSELKEQANSYRAGTTVTLVVYRPDGRTFRELELQVTLARYDELVTETAASAEEESSADSGEDGDSSGYPGSDSDMDALFRWFMQQMNGGQSSK